MIEQESRGIRPAVWVPIVLGVIAIGMIGSFARRSDKPTDSSTAEASPGESAVAPAENATAPTTAANTPSAKEAPAEVQAAFKMYRQALLDGDGEAAWSVIDSHTTRFYGQMLRDSLSLPARDLNRLDYIHRLTVLRLRTEFRKPQLQALTGRDVFVLAVTNGWISKSTVQSVPALQRVTVNGRYAQGYLPVDPRVPALYFIYEDSQWKLALWKTFEIANGAIRQMKQESGLSEKEFLLNMLRGVSKFEVSDRIFDGPLE